MSYAGDKSIHFFTAVKRSAEFQWTEECESEFMDLKQFLSTSLVLVCPKEKSPLTLYLAVFEKVVSLVLVQDSDGDKRSVYFVIKVLKRGRSSLSKDQAVSFISSNYRQETQKILSGPPYRSEGKVSQNES